MNNLNIRQNEALRIIAGIHIHNDALFHLGRRAAAGSNGRDRTVVIVADVIKRRHIDAADLCGKAQEFLTAFALAPALPVQLDDLEVNLFSVAEEKDIHKIGDRFGIARAGASRHHDMVQIMPVLTQNGDSAEGQHIEDIGIAQLILERKADKVKVGQRIAGFQRVERDITGAHLLLHIDPRCKYPLAPDIRLFIKKAVEDLDAEVGHSDLVGIGKAERKAHIDVTLVLDHLAQLSADITAGLLNLQQIFFDFFRVHRFHLFKNEYRQQIERCRQQ